MSALVNEKNITEEESDEEEYEEVPESEKTPVTIVTGLDHRLLAMYML